MALVKCFECSREISDKAASCPHCGVPIGLQNVIVKGVDPFAQYHSPIKGRSKGRITVIGFIGMFFVGPLIVFGGYLMAKDGLGQQGLMSMLFGAFMSIGCFLWARRPS